MEDCYTYYRYSWLSNYGFYNSDCDTIVLFLDNGCDECSGGCYQMVSRLEMHG